MSYYGIADIGSNTVVLVVYELHNGIPSIIEYRSEPVHLINYVHHGTMNEKGIRTAYETLRMYDEVLDGMNVDIRYADITEPGRIANRDELIAALEQTRFTIIPLSGEEEASCDYLGMKLEYPDVTEGIAFDVGGGSTEIISFENSAIVDAVSIRIGCVRLSRLPLDTPVCMQEIEAAAESYPSLAKKTKVLIGTGGTVRAMGRLIKELYGKKDGMYVSDIRETFERLCEQEYEAMAALRKKVSRSRIPVFLPGVHMVMELCSYCGAEKILVSDTGIREGFLLRYAVKDSEE